MALFWWCSAMKTIVGFLLSSFIVDTLSESPNTSSSGLAYSTSSESWLDSNSIQGGLQNPALTSTVQKQPATQLASNKPGATSPDAGRHQPEVDFEDESFSGYVASRLFEVSNVCNSVDWMWLLVTWQAGQFLVSLVEISHVEWRMREVYIDVESFFWVIFFHLFSSNWCTYTWMVQYNIEFYHETQTQCH